MAPRKKLKANKNTQQENMTKQSVDQVNEVEEDIITFGASKRGRTQQENMTKESVDQINEVEEDTVASGASKRGRTHMECLFNARRAGIRKEVAFNKLGQHVGSNAAKFESYIGVVAREKVKITYPTWKIVPEDVKEQIWKFVTLAFNVNRTRKKGCLRSAGVKWKQYKTTLTKEYGYKRKILPNLNIPPTKSGIDEIVWRDFVISRLSTNFMQMSDEHKKNAEINQLPHRFSRKGYARYALENVEIEELGSCSAKIQRSIHNDTPLDHTSTPVKLVGDDFDLKIVDEKIGLDNDDKLKGKSVALSLEPRTNIIAYGTIIKIYDPNELKHGIKLPKNLHACCH
ncbi:hypothetical protein ACS0TY_011047 [Phlomoides rotata]